MIYVMGDTHGNRRKWEEQIDSFLNPGDTVIVCGDFGFGFWGGCCVPEDDFFDRLEDRAYTVLFLDGNHENFDRLDALPVTLWNGGSVHRIRRNIIHLMRGELYSIENHSIFVFGGGCSADRASREDHVTWWSREMPSAAEYRRGEETLRSAGHCADYILTHTAPSETVYYLSTMGSLGIKSGLPEEFPLNAYLDGIRENTDYRHWYFGHFHADAELWRNQTVLFHSLRELKSGRVVREWASYEC